MEYEKIKQLIDDMGNSKLTSISIDFPDGTKISMTKQEENVKVVNVTSQEKAEVEIKEEPANESKEEKKTGNIITSPMVGTFYCKPSPTAEPYVEVGSQVNKGDTVCIVEAMKLMNEIESEYTGIIEEVLVKDGETVEYGTPLFRVV